MSKFLLCLPVSVCQSAHFSKWEPILTSQQFSMPVSPRHERVLYVPVSACQVSAFFKILTYQQVSIAVNSSHERVFIMSASFSMSVTARFMVC